MDTVFDVQAPVRWSRFLLEVQHMVHLIYRIWAHVSRQQAILPHFLDGVSIITQAGKNSVGVAAKGAR